MICPYGNEAGDPITRGKCVLKTAEGSTLSQCPCDIECAQLVGRGEPIIEDTPEGTVVVGYTNDITDPQTKLVTDFWVAAEEVERTMLADDFRSARPTL